jgi:phosphoribosylamine---glycine ligase
MRVLLIGNGGREHALAWRLSRSASVTSIVAAPGNPGISTLGECVSVDQLDPSAVAKLAEHLNADLVVVGPEAPLVAGVCDAVRERGIPVFGPSAAAAQLEGSKAFAKDVMMRAAVPTAASKTFTDSSEAIEYLTSRQAPYVIKADGLAAGKGVTVASSISEAQMAIRSALDDASFGAAGARVVIEDFLEGEEASLFCVTDGTSLFAMEGAQDFKRVGDGNTGPNTGGMGAYSPVSHLKNGIDAAVETICRPVIDQLAADGIPFTGLLYAGLMIDAAGNPSTVEFNARFGDPETQVILPRLQGDFGKLLLSAAQGELDTSAVTFSDKACVAVVLASGGYPSSYPTGIPIRGIRAAESDEQVTVFHAGTDFDSDGTLVTSGGRVLAVSATGDSVADARARAYEACAKIEFEGKQFRSDIAAGR